MRCEPDVRDGEVGFALLYPGPNQHLCSRHYRHPHASVIILGRTLRGRLGGLANRTDVLFSLQNLAFVDETPDQSAGWRQKMRFLGDDDRFA